MLSAARRTSCAFIRNPRTPATLSRTIAFSHPRPLQHLPKTKASNLYSEPRSSPSPILRHVPSFSHQTRSLSYLDRTRLGLKQASKGIWRKYPFLLPFAILGVIGSTLAFAYIVYVELFHNAPQYHKFPLEVVKPLRKAVYYTDVMLQPQLAVKYYKEALKAAAAVGMDPFSDEVIGIKLQVADVLERSGNVKPAINVFEMTKKEMVEWVQKGRENAAERQKLLDEQMKMVEKESKSHAKLDTKLEINNPQILDTFEQIQAGEENLKQQQDKCIKKAVGISLKLADLYDSDHMQDSKKSEEAAEAAVDLSMKELQYRENAGLPVCKADPDAEEHKTPYITQREAAMALSSLAQIYRNRDESGLAVACYMRALDLLRAEEGPVPTCSQARMIGDIASILTMQSVKAAAAVQSMGPTKNEGSEAARDHLIKHAEEWAMRGDEVQSKVPANKRNEHCKEACMTAKYMLGHLAQVQGNLEEAEKHFRTALAVANELDEPRAREAMIEHMEKNIRGVSKKK
ncbi:TPR domain protein [Aspergillus mulundensis]|uniref:Uncharacterized protein n=1 Tax=Aspergillus mulundensis TaxID=1810919 RepID=A0A3D8T4H0_9EURO|nr:hypothetical protein DSM5745_00683 [Aspergillus mulundensis]RDW93361.1 hypothetical protein DSM5745_00683 [Aspergillus mulundensis]